ncbi:MAG: hypothetical protein J0H01_05350 [Rhizobiales bacterium]|nr:hypothetical protein [Hyphomicrobiales bacterium]
MRALFFAAFAALTLLVSPVTAQAQGQQDFALINQTGYTIDEIYVSPASANSWGEDLAGDDSLEHGQQFNVSFRPGTQACNWDIRVVYDDGDSSEFRGVNLCSVSKVTLFWNRQAGTTRFVTE